jgi:hypothetical protein
MASRAAAHLTPNGTATYMWLLGPCAWRTTDQLDPSILTTTLTTLEETLRQAEAIGDS